MVRYTGCGCDASAASVVGSGHVDIERFARRLGVRLATDAPFAAAALAGMLDTPSGPVLWTHPGLQVVRRRELQARALAEWCLRRGGMRGSKAATDARSVGAHILAPRECVVRAWEACAGRRLFDRIARVSIELSIPFACAALRVAEVTSRPVAVLSQGRLIARGEREIDLSTARDMADFGPVTGYLCVTAPDRATHLVLAEDR